MQNKNIYTIGFDPVVNSNSTVLIVGTFPPCDRKEYYSHDNMFWQIIGDAIALKNLNELPYLEKKKILLKNGIALWDIFKEGYRKNGKSEDKNIVLNSIKHNNIQKDLLSKYKNIKFPIVVNGIKAKNILLEYNPNIGANNVIGLYATSRINMLKKINPEKYNRVKNEWVNNIKKMISAGDKKFYNRSIAKKTSDNKEKHNRYILRNKNMLHENNINAFKCIILDDAMEIILKQRGPTHYAELASLIGKSGLWLRPSDGKYPLKSQVHTRAKRNPRFYIANRGIVYLR